MKGKINLNFRLLCHAIIVSTALVGGALAGAYVAYLLLSLLFASPAIFASLSGLAVVVGVLFLYDGESFQWDLHPRVVIKRITEVLDDDDDEE